MSAICLWEQLNNRGFMGRTAGKPVANSEAYHNGRFHIYKNVYIYIYVYAHNTYTTYTHIHICVCTPFISLKFWRAFLWNFCLGPPLSTDHWECIAVSVFICNDPEFFSQLIRKLFPTLPLGNCLPWEIDLYPPFWKWGSLEFSSSIKCIFDDRWSAIQRWVTGPYGVHSDRSASTGLRWQFPESGSSWGGGGGMTTNCEKNIAFSYFCSVGVNANASPQPFFVIFNFWDFCRVFFAFFVFFYSFFPPMILDFCTKSMKNSTF